MENMVYRLTIFGNTDVIKNETDYIIRLLRTLEEYKVVPSAFQEIIQGKINPVSRPMLVSDTGDIKILFQTKRIDIELCKDHAEASAFTFDAFGEKSINILEKIYNQFKFSIYRIAIAADNIEPKISEKSQQKIKKIMSESCSFYKGKNLNSFSTKVASLEEIEINKKKLLLNISTLYESVIAERRNNNNIEKKNAHRFCIEVNTSLDNTDCNYSIEDIKDLKEKSNRIIGEILIDLGDVYND